MRRTIGLLVATCLLVIGATPIVVGQSETPSSDPGLQRVEVPAAGFSASFPASWDISIPMARRDAELPVATGATEPASETTLLWARAADGRWCDVDLYEGTALSMAGHAAWLQQRLASIFEIDRIVESMPVVLPAGDAWRIDMDDAVRGRSWVMYLLGSDTQQYLLSCADGALLRGGLDDVDRRVDRASA